MSEEPTIIGISPGPRYIGVAVLKGSDLKDWRLKVIKVTPKKERLLRIRDAFVQLFKRYRPTHLALKMVHPARGGPLLRPVVDLIRELSRDEGLVHEEYSIDMLKGGLGQKKVSSKREMANALAEMHPALQHTLAYLDESRTFYHMKVFEAVAAGRVCALRRFSVPATAKEKPPDFQIV